MSHRLQCRMLCIKSILFRFKMLWCRRNACWCVLLVRLLEQKEKCIFRLLSICGFTLEYRQVIKFLSVRWLGMQTCLERDLPGKQFPALQSYFRFVLLIAVYFFVYRLTCTLIVLQIIGRCTWRKNARLRRLITVFDNDMTEIYCYFLHACLTRHTRLLTFCFSARIP